MAINKKIGELSLHVVDAELTTSVEEKTISGTVKSYSETEEGVVLSKSSAFKIDDVDFEQPIHETVDSYVLDNLESIVSEQQNEVFETKVKKSKNFLN